MNYKYPQGEDNFINDPLSLLLIPSITCLSTLNVYPDTLIFTTRYQELQKLI